MKSIKSNIWKFFIIMLTGRRNYIAILSLYFLTLPNSTAQQIGLFTGIGWLAGFIFEIPSGYISDKIGHKKAIILSKISLLLSTILFISGTELIYFILGSTFISISFAFSSGTQEAFLHNTLINLKRQGNFSNIYGKMEANVSIISAAMIFALPFLTKISIIAPIKIYILFDLIGVIISFFLISPNMKYTAEEEEGGKNIFSQLKKFKGTGFYIISIFFGIIGASMMALTPYNVPYAELLGLPIVFAGAIMGLSRVFWFIIGHNLKILKKIKRRKLMIIEIVLFSSIFILSSQLKSAYLFVILMSFLSGYYNARKILINEYFLNTFAINKKYKATMLSIKSQTTLLIQTILVYISGIILGISFRLGYLLIGLFVFISLTTTYLLIKKEHL